MTTSYVFIRCPPEADRAAARAVVLAVLKWIDGQYQYEIIDESYLPNTFDNATLVLKLDGTHTAAQISRDLAVLIGELPGGVEAQFVPGADAWPLDMAEIDVQYFRDETKVDSRMVVWGLSCVQLIHRPSGLVARCRWSRNRQRNFDGATALLKAILASTAKQNET